MAVSIHSLRIEGIHGDEIRLDQFKGKKLLIVNVASECGFTPQYEQLEALYKQYEGRLAILGCPCNDFGRQEPGTEADILTFCQVNYGVTFPLTKKIKIKSRPVEPLYAWLTEKGQNGVADSEVTWNFQKYAISPDGEWQACFGSAVEPFDEQILHWIETA